MDSVRNIVFRVSKCDFFIDFFIYKYNVECKVFTKLKAWLASDSLSKNSRYAFKKRDKIFIYRMNWQNIDVMTLHD